MPDASRSSRFCCVAGTRPELIKMAPVVQALRKRGAAVDLVHSGQHTSLAEQAFVDLGIAPDETLVCERAGSDLSALCAGLFKGLSTCLQAARPHAVLVHGDTATAAMAGLAAFYLGIPVAHIEAGLRCPSLAEPFPEEGQRRLLSRLARWHFAPTLQARNNLLAERAEGDIIVTGNTVIDAMLGFLDRWKTSPHSPAIALKTAMGEPHDHTLLITAHRRENWGQSIDTLIQRLAHWMNQSTRNRLIWPLHPNPDLQAQIHRAFDHPDFAACRQRIGLCQALAYPDMVWAMQHCKAIITDSGGLQEEASAFSKPVLVLRDSTERPEAIAAGYAQLIGSQSAGLLTALQDLQNTNWAAALNAADGLQRWPFGDGQASERIAQCLMRHSNPIKATRPHAEQLQKADQHQHEQP